MTLVITSSRHFPLGKMPFSSVHEGTVRTNGNTVFVNDIVLLLFIIAIIDVKKRNAYL